MIFAIAVCLISALIAWWYKRPREFPPGPRGLPFVGVIPFLGKRPDMKLQEWSKHYGPILSIRIASQDWVILNSYDIIMEAMVRKGRQTAGRPSNYILDNVFDGKDKGIALSSGKIWETHRKFADSAFRLLGVGRQRFEAFILDEVEIFMHEIIEKTTVASDYRSDVGKVFSNIVNRFAFGKRFEYTDKIFIRVTNDLMADKQNAKLFNAAIVMPLLRFLPPVARVLSNIKTQRQSVFDCFNVEIEKHKLSVDSGDVKDFVDIFLREQMQEREQNGKNLYFTNEQLPIILMNFFAGGIDTSTATTLWCFLGLLHFPQFQEKIQNEIDEVFGENPPSIAHKQSMHFTQAYIHEIQRFCTVSPLALPHSAVENVKIGGYFIPKNTQVIVNLRACHHDPNIFANPSDFRPQRFLDSESCFVKSPRVIPFMVGPRHCPGESLATMEVFLFLVATLQKLSLKPDSAGLNELPGMDDGIPGPVYYPKQFKILFIPRNKGEH